MTDKKFTSLPACRQLKELAREPIDLTLPGSLTAARVKDYYVEACGYKLLYATERITDEVISTLAALAEQADVYDKMKSMQAGEILNFIRGEPSENRAVLHTATRDFFEDPQQALPAREAAELARDELEKLRAFSMEIDASERFTDLIMIGIGGSDLGPQAIFFGLEYLKKKGRRIYFINNVDPDNAAAVLQSAKLSQALVVVVSKSGSTLETAVNAEFVKTRFVEAGLKPEKHFIAVTGEGSPMSDPSRYLEAFYIWDWIGGRYSSTSMVGGVLLSFAFGFDVYYEFLRGANAMDKVALKRNVKENLPLFGALLSIWNRNFLDHPSLAIIPYSHALRRFSAHIQQLSMESNGKHIDKNGEPVDFKTGELIWGEPGTNAQHSFYQLIHQGTDIIPLEFIGYKEGQWEDDLLFLDTTSQEKLNANLFAQAIGLATGQKGSYPNKEFCGNRPSHILLGTKLTPFALGALLSYFEHKTAFQGFIWDINSFDQEGVELGKVLANKIIGRFASRKGIKNTEKYPLGDAYLDHLK